MMTNLLIYQTSIAELINYVRDIFISARQGLTSDRSVIDTARAWFLESSEISAEMSDSYVDIAVQGLRYKPLFISIVIVSVIYAIGSSLDLCRGISEENRNLNSGNGIEWVLTVLSLVSASFESSASDVPPPRLLSFTKVAGFLSFFGSVIYYCTILASTDIIGTIFVFFAVVLVSLFVWVFFFIMTYPLVGAPVAYLHTMYRALGVLFKR